MATLEQRVEQQGQAPDAVYALQQHVQQIERMVNSKVVNEMSTNKDLQVVDQKIDKIRSELSSEQAQTKKYVEQLKGMCTDLREITQEALTTVEKNRLRIEALSASWEAGSMQRGNSSVIATDPEIQRQLQQH